MAIVHVIDGVIPFSPLWQDHAASSGEQDESQRNRYYLLLEHNSWFPTHLSATAEVVAAPSGTGKSVEKSPQLTHVDISLTTEILRLSFFLQHDLAYPD